MTNVFDGPPDGRQSDDQQMPTSRFRPRYRALSEEEKALHDEIKLRAEQLEEIFGMVEVVRKGTSLATARYHALALTYLEIAIMFSIKGLTS